MSELPPISSRFGLDTGDFKGAISQINREMRLVESGFRASAAALGDWSQSATGLESRIGTLTEKMDLQRVKVEALKLQYEQMQSSGTASERSMTEQAIKVNKATEELNKMERELGENQDALEKMKTGSDKASDSVEKLGRESDTAGGKLEGFKKIAGNIGSVLKGVGTAVAGVGAAVAGVGLAAGKLVTDAAASAGALVDLSVKTGLSTDKLQEFAYIGEQVGTSQETITGSLSKLVRSMDAARAGTGDAGKAFQTLGIRITDANGNLRDNSAVFADVIDALGKIPNETERDALSMRLFGKSAQELNPLIAAGTEEINRLAQEARDMGAVIDGDAVQSLAGFNDTLASIKLSLQGVGGSVAAAFLPGFQGLGDQVKGYLGDIAQVVQQSDGDLGKAAAGIGKIFGGAVSDLAKQAPEIMQAGIDLLKGLIEAVVTNLPTLVTSAVEILTSLLGFIVENLPMLIEAGLQMIITLANAMAEALPELIPAVLEIIPKVVLTLLENLPQLIDAALKLILALAEGLIAAIPVLIPYIPQIVEAIFTAIIESLPLIGEAAVELIMTLVEGIGNSLPELGAAAVDTINAFREGYYGMIGEIFEVGINIVSGVWEGINSRATWFAEQVGAFFSGIVDSAKRALGIQSPSRVFAGIGENMALGLGLGFEDSFGDVERGVKNAVNGLTADASGGLGSGAAAYGQQTQIQLGGIHVHITGDAGQRPDDIGQRIGDAAGRALVNRLRAVGV